MYLLKFLSVAFVFCLFQFPLFSKDVRVLFTGQLNGYLETCECGIELTPGFVKQSHFINQYRKEYPYSIVLDTGNLIASGLKSDKIVGVFEAYNLTSYDGVLPGESELNLSPQRLKQITDLNWVLTNIRIKKGIFSKEETIGKMELNFVKNDLKVRVLGLWDESVLNKVYYTEKAELRYFQWEKYLTGKEQELLIVLIRGELEFAKKLSGRLSCPMIILGDYDKNLVKKDKPLQLKKNVWFVSSGKNGGNVGELKFDLTEGQITSLFLKYHHIDPETAKDDPKIKKIVKRLGL